MEAKYVSKEGNDITFTIDFSAEEFEEAQGKAYRKTKGKYRVNGFRQGKAPRSIIEQHYGQGVFMEEALEDLMQVHYPKAIETLDIDPIDRPRIDVDNLTKGEGFTVTAVVTVTPEITLGDYSGIQIEDIVHTVTDEDVEKEIEAARQRNSRLIEVDRPAENGDTVTIDYKGSSEGEFFDGGSAEDYNLKLGGGHFIPGFEEQLIGAKKDEEVQVKVTFPEEYHAEKLKGKDAIFEVKVKAVKTEELPEADDAFAEEASEFETLEEWKKNIHESLVEAAKNKEESEKKNAVLEALYNAHDVDIPDVMVEDQMDEMMNEFAQNIRQQGMDFNLYLKYMGQDPKEFRENLRQDAFKRVKMRLLIRAVAEAEDFDASEEEVEREIDEMASHYDMEVDKLKEALGESQRTMLRQDIRNRKAVDYMFETAVLGKADEAKGDSSPEAKEEAKEATKEDSKEE